MKHLLLPLLLCAGFVGRPAEARRLPPVDTCASDIGFAAFRAALNRAIARRDAAFILSAASDDISWSFGDEPGRAGFARAWGLSRPASSRLWRELAEALRLGCRRADDGSLWAPAMSLNEEDADMDAFENAVVAVTPGAVLRARPADNARPVAALRWDVLTLADGDDGTSAWARASLEDGRSGWVRRSQVRSFGDYRAVFERRGGRWRMTAFVAGD
jgi:hypothetical protein